MMALMLPLEMVAGFALHGIGDQKKSHFTDRDMLAQLLLEPTSQARFTKVGLGILSLGQGEKLADGFVRNGPDFGFLRFFGEHCSGHWPPQEKQTMVRKGFAPGHTGRRGLLTITVSTRTGCPWHHFSESCCTNLPCFME